MFTLIWVFLLYSWKIETYFQNKKIKSYRLYSFKRGNKHTSRTNTIFILPNIEATMSTLIINNISFLRHFISISVMSLTRSYLVSNFGDIY